MDYVCVRCRSAIEIGASDLTCTACGQHYPVISTIPILVQRPNALLIDLQRTLESAVGQFARSRQRLVHAAEANGSAGLRGRVERWCRGVEHNLELIREHMRDVGVVTSGLPRSSSDLLDWMSIQNGGWWPRATLPYFYQDWGGTAAFAAVEALIGTTLEQHAPDRRRAVVLGAGACGIASAVKTRFERVDAVDLSLPTLLMARALLAGQELEFHLEKARWRRVRLSANPAPERVELAVADANALPFAEATQSVVITQYLMDLVGNPLHVAAEIQRVLVPGGIWINFSIPFLLPGEPVEVGPPDLAEVSDLLHARGWDVRHATRERFMLTSVEAIHDGGERVNHEVHFVVARKRPDAAPPPHWFSAADWNEWRASTVPERQPQITWSGNGDGRATIRVGRMAVTADAALAAAIESLFGLIDGRRPLQEITAAMTPQLALTEREWRELFHYLSDCYGLVELVTN